MQICHLHTPAPRAHFDEPRVPGPFVAEVLIVPFLAPPDVLVWGTRTFTYYNTTAPDPAHQCQEGKVCRHVQNYVEAFAVYAGATGA